MSKDNDFLKLIEQHGPPPQIIWITCGNTSNARMRQILSETLLKAKEQANQVLLPGSPLDNADVVQT